MKTIKVTKLKFILFYKHREINLTINLNTK